MLIPLQVEINRIAIYPCRKVSAFTYPVYQEVLNYISYDLVNFTFNIDINKNFEML